MQSKLNLTNRVEHLFDDLGPKYSDIQQLIAETSEQNATCSMPHRRTPTIAMQKLTAHVR
jgi:hypothetical protein